MKEQVATFIALLLVPLFAFGFRLIPRLIVEWLYRISPDGWFKRLLARDRASRAKRG